MVLSEYLDTVTEQIRCKKARPMVREELENHVLEQAEAYEAEGMGESEAMEAAVRQMGDPVETGNELDRIHKPRLEWKLLLMVLLLSVMGLVFQYLISREFSLEKFGTADYLWRRQCFYTAAGLCVMFAVYIFDFTLLGRYPLVLWFGYILLILFMMFTYGTVYGKIRIFNYLTLFLPLYAGVLYRLRTKGYAGAAVCFLFSFVPFFLGMKTVLFHGSMELAVCCYLLLLLAVWRGYFNVRKGWTMAILAVIPLLGLAVLYLWGEKIGILAAYQYARLEALVNLNLSGSPWNQVFIENVVSGLQIFGPSTVPIQEGMGAINMNYVIFFIFARYGIAAGSIVVLLLAAVAIKVFLVSWKQKNRFGFLIGMACAMVLSIQMVVYILSNFGVALLEPLTIPFLSYGGQSTLVNYILVGLVLGIYRSSNIVSERQIEKNRWKIRLERE